MKRSLSGRYRKKPVVIEAYQWRQFDEDVFHGRRTATVDGIGWPAWLQEAWRAEILRKEEHFDGLKSTVVGTLEGPHTVSVDDWIIRGVQGELYPCRDDIFNQTYEPAEDE